MNQKKYLLSFRMSIRMLSTILAVIILNMDISADIGPEPMTAGRSLHQYDAEVTDVRMVEEDVHVRIFEDSIVTVAEFLMFNEGETVQMEVGFPYSYPDEFVEFSAFVDGRPVKVKDGKVDDVGHKKGTAYWKLWDVTFKEGEPCSIRVVYRTNPIQSSIHFSKKLNPYSAISFEVYEELQRNTTSSRVTYWLATGRPWKGILDRCRVEFEVVGRTDEYVGRYGAKDGKGSGRGIVWEYTDYEPASYIHLEYYPNMKVDEIPPYLWSVYHKYPGNALLTHDIARSLFRFEEDELGLKVEHSYLAGWNGFIPALVDRSDPTECRSRRDSISFFYTYMIARELLKKYEKRGSMNKAVDIAPVISRIAGAYVDSLGTCGDLRETSELYREAKELLDRSNGLLERER